MYTFGATLRSVSEHWDPWCFVSASELEEVPRSLVRIEGTAESAAKR